MLKSYEAIFNHERLIWLGKTPPPTTDRVLVIIDAPAETAATPSNPIQEIERIVETTFGAWGNRSLEEVDRMIEAKRKNDWGDST